MRSLHLLVALTSLLAVACVREGFEGAVPPDADSTTPTPGPTATPPENPETDWHDADFERRIPIFVDNGGPTLENFPVLVQLDADFEYGAVRPDGRDILFVDPDGTVLSLERETWVVDGESVLWVRIPSIDAESASDHFWLYYSSPGATPAQDPSDVWDGYSAVWHLFRTNPSLIYDSTVYANDARETGDAQLQSALIADGMSFGSNGGDLRTQTTPSLTLANSSFTITGWVNSEQSGGGDNRPMASLFGAQNQGEYLHVTTNVAGSVRLDMGGDDGSRISTSEDVAPPGTWNHWAVTYDLNTDESTLYVNGQVEATGNVGPYQGVNAEILFGDTLDPSESLRSLRGQLDEIRVLQTALTPEWIEAQFRTQGNSFLMFGEVEARP